MKIENRYKLLMTSAKSRGINVNLNKHHYAMMIEMGCAYCGIELKNSGGVCLDRLDSKRGYNDDNVTPCCKRCNAAKNDMSSDEFFTWIDRVYNHKKQILEMLNEVHKSEAIYKKTVNTLFNQRKFKNSGELIVEGDGFKS